jgi:hypothetical protein
MERHSVVEIFLLSHIVMAIRLAYRLIETNVHSLMYVKWTAEVMDTCDTTNTGKNSALEPHRSIETIIQRQSQK